MRQGRRTGNAKEKIRMKKKVRKLWGEDKLHMFEGKKFRPGLRRAL